MSIGVTAFAVLVYGALALVAVAPVILLALFIRDRSKRELW